MKIAAMSKPTPAATIAAPTASRAVGVRGEGRECARARDGARDQRPLVAVRRSAQAATTAANSGRREHRGGHRPRPDDPRVDAPAGSANTTFSTYATTSVISTVENPLAAQSSRIQANAANRPSAGDASAHAWRMATPPRDASPTRRTASAAADSAENTPGRSIRRATATAAT